METTGYADDDSKGREKEGHHCHALALLLSSSHISLFFFSKEKKEEGKEKD
jgi:hypothetical protein